MAHIQPLTAASSSNPASPVLANDDSQFLAHRPPTPPLRQPSSNSQSNPSKSQDEHVGLERGHISTLEGQPSSAPQSTPSPHGEQVESDSNSNAPLNPRFSDQPLPLPPQAQVYDRPPVFKRQVTTDTRKSRRSHLEHVVPSISADSFYEKLDIPKFDYTSRLDDTIQAAEGERKKYEKKAKYTAWALNIAIGLQVLLASLTTGLSAAATTGKSAAIQTTILGGLATIVASYLARARGSGEPELSITRLKDLEQFLRECRAFITDCGHLPQSQENDEKLIGFRKQFEDLLGNANGFFFASSGSESFPHQPDDLSGRCG